MKKTHFGRPYVRLLCLALVALLLLPLLAACNKGDKNGEEEETDAPPAMIDIVKDGKTKYTMVCNNSDALSSDTAELVWNMLYEAYGVSLTQRSDRSEYEYEIVICNADRAEIEGLEAELADDNDFIIRNSGKKLFLYAKTSTGAKRMLIALREEIFTNAGSGTFTVAENLDLRGGDKKWGSSLTLIDGDISEYRIIHSDMGEEDVAVAYYLQREIKRLCGVKLPVSSTRLAEKDKEILIGRSIKRNEFSAVISTVGDGDDFCVSIQNQKLVIAAKSATALLQSAMYFLDAYIEPAAGGKVVFYEEDEYRHSMSASPYEVDYTEYAELCSSIFGWYPTLVNYYMSKHMTQEVRDDQALCEDLVERMGESAALQIGSSSALWNGYIYKLDVNDYSLTATKSGNAVNVPASFANRFFGVSTYSGTVDIKAQAESKGYTVLIEGDLVILTASGVASFADGNATDGKHTNTEYKNRMIKFFTDTAALDPSNNTEQSRVVIEDAVNYYPEDSVNFELPIYINYYSPAVLSVQRNGKTVLYSANERCQTQNGAEPSTLTVIHRSDDGGKTWKEIDKIVTLNWASFFEVNGTVYLVGNLRGAVTLYKFTNDKVSGTYKLIDGTSAITNPAVIDGILYLPLDFTVASCPINKDITNPENWTKTEDPSDLVTVKWLNTNLGYTLGGAGGDGSILEGNAVKGKDGKIYILWRLESAPNADRAVMLRLSGDRSKLEWPGTNQKDAIVSLPTTISRFGIQYDAELDLYVCLSNWWTVNDHPRARNVVGLSVSRDLKTWIKIDEVLVDRAMVNEQYSCLAHAFQYFAWDIDGEDIVLTVRETQGFANTFHDGKYFTFYRLSNFRELINSKLGN